MNDDALMCFKNTLALIEIFIVLYYYNTMSKVTKVVNNGIIWSVIIAVIILVVTSVIVRDYEFIVKRPLAFGLELFVVSVVCSFLICIVFLRTRNVPVKDTLTWFIAITIKFALFHILFQLSGVYTILFQTA